MSLSNRDDVFIHPDLPCLLNDFILSVIDKQPTNCVEFGAKYFSKLAGYEFDGSETDSISSTDEEDSLYSSEDENRRRQTILSEKFDPEEVLKSATVGYPKTALEEMHLTQQCAQLSFLRNLDREDLKKVVKAMFRVEVVEGEEIIKEGESGDNFYVVESGSFEATTTRKGKLRVVTTYDNCGYFGELSLIYNAPRAATVKATSDGVLWGLNRLLFRSLIVVQAQDRRSMYGDMLRSLPLFSALTSNEIQSLADALIPVTFEDNEVIMYQDQPGYHMYFIECGEVKISNKLIDSDGEVTRLKSGAYFGELALITRKPRTATATSVGCTKCAMLDVKSFERLLGPCVDLLKKNAESYLNQFLVSNGLDEDELRINC